MLENGGSLSGRERNCCFLNTGGTRFADISAVSGFDFPDDTRSISLSDWDQDGDLDVWMTNRTAPRVRFLQNDYDSGNQSVLIKLQGVQSNRDGIGARVELILGSGKGRLMRTLRAGEGYLGQASKWMHFGLGAAEIQQAGVRWPSGRSEVFRGVTAGGRFLLTEGQGTAVRQPARNTELPLASVIDAPPATTDVVRLVVPARLPIPRIAYRDLVGREVSLTDGLQGPLLINLWSTACQPCLEELAAWSKRQPDFEATGVRVVLLCVDGLTTDKSNQDADAVQQLVDRMKLPFAVGLATTELLDALDIAQQVLTRRIRTLPVPTSFLVDRQGRLAVVYKGPADAEQVLADIGQLSLPTGRHRDLAISFPGSWYTLPFPPDLMAIPKQYRKLGQPERAFRYLKRNVPTSIDSPSSKAFFEVTSPQSLAAIYIDLAKELQGSGKPAAVIEALQAASQLQPRDGRPRMALAMILQQAGRPGDAVRQYREFLEQNPDDPVIANNLAWLLATCKIDQVRDPEEAIKLAKFVCEKSRRKLPSALDTLAAAYAAAGRFDEAVATIREAISLLDSAGQADYSAAMRARLNLYLGRQAYIEKR